LKKTPKKGRMCGGEKHYTELRGELFEKREDIKGKGIKKARKRDSLLGNSQPRPIKMGQALKDRELALGKGGRDS